VRPSPYLRKWQRNQIFKAIQGAGLDPKEFAFEDGDAEVRIKHKWSESYFMVGGNAAHYVGSYVVGDARDWPYEVYSWQTLMTRVSRWLEEVKHDLETPDLWAELQREAEMLGGASNEPNENTPFTREEQKEIAGRLRELAEHLSRTHSLSEPELQVLNAKLDYLVDAASRVGRIDWRNAFVGVALSYILGAAFPPESARSIFQTFVALLRTIGHFYGLPQLPLGTL
jgi:hypothetical protein